VEKVSPPEGLFSSNVEIRLRTLSDYIKQNPKTINNGWINLHIHTNESFSVFTSPTEAVWHAFNQNVEFFGINDHYTIAGHPEFKNACEIAGLKGCFSIETIGLDRDTFDRNRRFNDPKNPGRIYLVGKGVTQDLKPGSKSHRVMTGMRDAIKNRNRKIVEKLSHYAQKKGYKLNLSYKDVMALTPNGNATERHVVQAFCEKIDQLASEKEKKSKVLSDILGVMVDEKLINDQASLQDLVRSRLVKNGMPCYVEEDLQAFTSIENIVHIYLDYGAVPTYPFLGHPVTEEEKNLEMLIKKVLNLGMYAFDLIDRIEIERAREIIEVASHYGFPVFIGTEHNTKVMQPLVGKVGKYKKFYDYFKKSAQFVVGHQLLSRLCDFSYIDERGKPRIENLKMGFEIFSRAGGMNINEDQYKELLQKTVFQRKKFFGI